MTTLKQCDGCDQTERSGTITDEWEHIVIEIRGGRHVCDLCPTCVDIFLRKHLPMNWVRAEKEKTKCP